MQISRAMLPEQIAAFLRLMSVRFLGVVVDL